MNELAAALGDDANFSTTVTNLINANETHIDNMATLTGAAKDAVNLGTFSGSTIADSVTIKAALQALETSLETKAAAATVTEVDGNVDDLISLTGIAENTANLGTFTGSTIADNQTVKAAIQAVETAVELRSLAADGVFTGTTKHEKLRVDDDGSGFFLNLDRISTTQIDISTANIPSGGNLNIKNSNGTDAKVVVYSDLFWCRNLGGSNGNGTAQFDGSVYLKGGALTITDNTADSLQILEGSNQYLSFDFRLTV